MTISPLELIRQQAPAWLEREHVSAAVLIGEAIISATGAALDWRIQLAISERNRAVEVREQRPGQQLPLFCPQRHINEDQSFCIGYGVDLGIASADDAAVWWGLLHQYLVLQRIASRTRRWPPRQALSHGEAGRHQIRAQESAKRIGIFDQYLDLLDGAEHWLRSRHIVLNRAGDGLINGRSRCPIGCTRSRGKPRLRRECCRKKDLVELVHQERLREAEERAYCRKLQERNVQCCGTMEQCPIAQAE